MRRQETPPGTLGFVVVGGNEQFVRGVDGHARRLVQQQRDGLHRLRLHAGIDLHPLVRQHARLRQRLLHAVDAHRAVLYQQFRIAPRHACLRGHALGQADAFAVDGRRVGHCAHPCAASWRMRATCAASERAATGHIRSGTSS